MAIDEAQDNERLLAEVAAFVEQERDEADRQLHDIWSQPLAEKLLKGQTQHFARLERGDDGGTLWAWLGDGESRFREGDLLRLHGGDSFGDLYGRRFAFELEEDDRWLLRGLQVTEVIDACGGGACYADPDTIDLTPYYQRALGELRTSSIGRDVVLPLLGGRLAITFDGEERGNTVAEGERAALAEGFNAKQAEAVGLAVGADQIACIQGPPGTGKTRVLALIARLLTQSGERVLLTSHTHMAIHNALNKVHAQGVACVKIGRETQRKGLDEAIACCPRFGAWKERPTDGGYVIGATPFATCNARLEHCEFDTVIFDEASQVTVALALMAMRVGRRYVFIGDHKQLPPVVLSRSVLSGESPSVFARLTSQRADHNVMLTETYRMNRWLAAWPSRQYYGGALVAAGDNRDKRLCLAAVPPHLAAVFDPAASGVFIPTCDASARTRNARDAALVADLCEAAQKGGVALSDIGIVTPYRAQGRAVRTLLARRFGREAARAVVADTVERMQGQERLLVILSLATGDEVFLRAVAAFFFQPERLNVAITRPVSKLIVIGPELNDVPHDAEAPLRDWITQYIDLLRHLTRVVV